MAVTLTPATGSTGPGRSATRPSYAMAPRSMVQYPFTITFDTSYPTGGESIAVADVSNSPYAVLRTIDRIDVNDAIAPGGTGGSTSGDVMHGVVDYTNKKILLFLSNSSADMTQATSTGNYSLITLRCTAWGYL